MNEGIGLYRGIPDPIGAGDAITPGAPPAERGDVPVTGEQGPPINLPLEAWKAHLDLINKFGEYLNATTRPNDPSNVSGGTTDSSGNAVIGCYTVAAGEEFRVSRVVVEVSGYTASAPYSGVGFCGIYEVDSSDGVSTAVLTGEAAFGGLRDVAAGSATQAFLPAIFEYGDHQSPRIRGPRQLAVVLSAGPASKRVSVFWQGRLRRMSGVA